MSREAVPPVELDAGSGPHLGEIRARVKASHRRPDGMLVIDAITDVEVSWAPGIVVVPPEGESR